MHDIHGMLNALEDQSQHVLYHHSRSCVTIVAVSQVCSGRRMHLYSPHLSVGAKIVTDVFAAAMRVSWSADVRDVSAALRSFKFLSSLAADAILESQTCGGAIHSQ